MIEYGKVCSKLDYAMALLGRIKSDAILDEIVNTDDPKRKAYAVCMYNYLCSRWTNDRCDYTLGELEDMYYGPFSIRPECFAIEIMHIQ